VRQARGVLTTARKRPEDSGEAEFVCGRMFLRRRRECAAVADAVRKQLGGPRHSSCMSWVDSSAPSPVAFAVLDDGEWQQGAGPESVRGGAGWIAPFCP